jgi:mono/diheme cytochrome c family protein
MLRVWLAALACAALAVAAAADSGVILRAQRSSPGDLEVSGDLAGLVPGSIRYVRYEDLLRLPQETYTVSDDADLPRNAVISGVALATLAHLFGQSPESTQIVAISYDRYRTNYPRSYLAQHHPLLVLRIDGRLSDAWPQSEQGGPLGPYLISHPFFKPAFKALSHDDEPQIPFGVERLEFRRESKVFDAIRPPGHWPAGSAVEQGYVIARQDCFRCHNAGAEGGTKAGRDWRQLAALAQNDAPRFRRIIHDPASVTPGAKMPGEPGYDDATLDALTAYFKTFACSRPSPSPQSRRNP